MSIRRNIACAAALAGAFALSACADNLQQATPAKPATPPTPAVMFATTKVADNVYIFRYQGHQSMFVVTPAGVIATDPISYQRPQAALAYIAEIKKVTDKPIRYVIYSHHHYDHAAGGKPFKDLGAKFIAHKNATAHLRRLKHPDVVMPDISVDNLYVLNLGGTRLELHYVGRNHSDNSLAMFLPKEKILFTVDFAPIQSLQFRDMPDTASVPELFTSLDRILALNWDKMIPGHPYAGGRLGTKQDIVDHKQYLTDLSAAVKQYADTGKCTDVAMKEIKLPKYEKWGNYETFLPGNIERFCYYLSRGY